MQYFCCRTEGFNISGLSRDETFNMKTARVGKTEVGGISCVFLDTNSRILHPVTVSGHLAAVSLSSVGLQIWDEQVLQSVRALTGRRSGEVSDLAGNISSCPDLSPPLSTPCPRFRSCLPQLSYSYA